MRSVSASRVEPRGTGAARRRFACSCARWLALLAVCGGSGAGCLPTTARAQTGAGERPLAEALDVEALMARLAATRGVRAHFREEKQIALLAEPLVSEGWLYVVPPDRLLRITDRPAPSRLVIEGDRLVMQDELGREEIDLASQPAARHFVDHMLLVFRGDLARLRERYELDYHASGDAWRLSLAPRDRMMRHIVERIVLEGEGPVLSSMTLAEPGGDATYTRFDSVEVDRAFAPSELVRLFRGDDDPAVGAPPQGGAVDAPNAAQ